MQLLREAVGKSLKQAGLDPGLLERPPRPEMGDLAYPCFGMAEKKEASPVGIARELAEKISSKLKPGGVIKMVEALGPYVNFHADWERLGGTVIMEVLKKGD